MTYIYLIIGFALLTFCADALVNGSSAIAKRFHVSDIVIGLTIVAFGTSAPELVVNIIASSQGSNEIAMTNILGSNTLNTLLILGLTAVISPVFATKRTLHHEVPLSIIAGFSVMILASNMFGSINIFGDIGLSHWDGVILLLGFGYFLYYTISCIIKDKKRGTTVMELPETKSINIGKAIIYIVIGLAGLVIGGKLIVENAIIIARNFGVSEAVIGVTVVAVGTSLPELATSAVAAFRHNTELAIGNVIGSNIFNIFFILGISSLIKPIANYPNLMLDASLATASSLLLLFYLLNDHNRELSRIEGASMVIFYALYVYLILK
ncbi:MAG: calcium/sodium antiporter [Paludibacteraceae bacterium]|nr:calcium/sodium antiporter [Paludibacteraceae bacterium]